MNESKEDHRFSQLVVIGASAGGIEALSGLVGNLPGDFSAPIVVAQHLSPHRTSSLEEILARRAPLPVKTVSNSDRLQPGTIYVVPPNRDVSIRDHTVRVHHDDGAGPRPSIDLLFRSAAEAYREDLIAIVLSGTGSDGANGAREVKQAGGTVIIQNPDSASFPGMPLSLSPSIVDIVADPDRIGPLLQDLLSGTFAVPQPTEETQFRTFLDQLREESGIDFTSYKQPTITRRLQRRMVATDHKSIGDYLRFLKRHPEERQRLIASFLIKVTEFYRDPELFSYLREHVLPELMADAQKRGAELRLWSAGCATGEEAYSLAMIAAELTNASDAHANVRIFATDLDAEAVAFARRGTYPARALKAVPASLLERYFIEIDGEYEVRKDLRSMLVFGEHDLGQRAPFPRIDLVLCRNVLIYFTSALQRRALQLFAFSLRPGGYLVVGKSETVSPLAEYFAVDQPRQKVFRRVGERAPIPASRIKEAMNLAPPPRPVQQLNAAATLARSTQGSRDLTGQRAIAKADDVLLELPMGVVVIDQNYDIQLINTTARRIFGIHTHALDSDFLHLVKNFSPDALRTAIDAGMRGEAVAGVRVETEDELPVAKKVFVISCFSLPMEERAPNRFVVLVANDDTERSQLLARQEFAEANLSRLRTTNDEVLVANQELTGTIAKLRAENEDLLVSAEEVQAATEEVETLNEELQASNEELETLNEELQATVEELNTTNDDLQARTIEIQEAALRSDVIRARLEGILSNISDAVLVIDQAEKVVLTNPAYDATFGAAGISQIFEDDTEAPIPAEHSPLRRAARGESFDMSFTMFDGESNRRWFEARGRPVPGEAGHLGVIAIRDISERSLRHLQDQWLSIASHELRTPLAAVRAFVQLAERGLPKEGAEKSHDYLDKALQQSRRIETLVYQMLEATRLQHGQIELITEDVDLVPLMNRTVEIAQVFANNQAIVFRTRDQELMVRGDAARIEQVVLNLLNNAMLHAMNSKRIDVRLRRVTGMVEIAVQDHGQGIPAEELATIFDRYRQGTGVHAGLGLGLYIAREIVAQHGGTLTVTSTVGKGSTFVVRLPLSEQHTETSNPRSRS